jgi:hypothetical protein
VLIGGLRGEQRRPESRIGSPLQRLDPQLAGRRVGRTRLRHEGMSVRGPSQVVGQALLHRQRGRFSEALPGVMPGQGPHLRLARLEEGVAPIRLRPPHARQGLGRTAEEQRGLVPGQRSPRSPADVQRGVGRPTAIARRQGHEEVVGASCGFLLRDRLGDPQVQPRPPIGRDPCVEHALDQGVRERPARRVDALDQQSSPHGRLRPSDHLVLGQAGRGGEHLDSGLATDDGEDCEQIAAGLVEAMEALVDDVAGGPGQLDRFEQLLPPALPDGAPVGQGMEQAHHGVRVAIGPVDHGRGHPRRGRSEHVDRQGFGGGDVEAAQFQLEN